MRDIRVVLLLAALLPGAVQAQPAPPEPLLTPPLVSASEEPAFAPVGVSGGTVEAEPGDGVRPYALSPGRVAVEVVGGTAGGVVSTFASVAVLSLANADEWSCRGDVCDGRAIGALALMGCALGSTMGVYTAGELMAGGGRFLPTMAAGLAMGGVTAGLYYAGLDDSSEVVLPLMALPMITSIVAYEVSAAHMPARPPRLQDSRPAGSTWAPVISLTPSGGALGLAGRF